VLEPTSNKGGAPRRVGEVGGLVRMRCWEGGKVPKGRTHQGGDNPYAIFGAWVRFRV
jgi:hypothetical protein